MTSKDPFTEEEREVMDLLIEAHNKYARLPVLREDVGRNWADGIHICQAALGQRVLIRDYPDVFVRDTRPELTQDILKTIARRQAEAQNADQFLMAQRVGDMGKVASIRKVTDQEEDALFTAIREFTDVTALLQTHYYLKEVVDRMMEEGLL